MALSNKSRKGGYIPPHLRKQRGQQIVVDKMGSGNDSKCKLPTKSRNKSRNPFITDKEKKAYNPFTDNEAANKRFEETLAECKIIKESNMYQTVIETKPFHANKYNEKTKRSLNNIKDSW